jgi:transposase-like protein
MAGQRSIAEIARKYGVPYSTLWRSITGGFRRRPRLPKDLARRLQQALKELGLETGEGR